MIREKTVSAENSSIGAVMEFVRDYLYERKAQINYINESVILCEEIMTKIAAFGEDTDSITVKIKRSITGSCISFSFKGRYFELYDDPDDIGTKIISAYSNNIKQSHRDGMNKITVLINHSYSTQTRISHIAILLAIVIAVVIKLTGGEETGRYICEILAEPVSSFFVRALTFIANPVIFFSLVSLIAKMVDVRNHDSYRKRMIINYAASSALAVIIGITVFFLCTWVMSHAGMIDNLSEDGNLGVAFSSFKEMILNFIPESIVEPFSSGNPFALLFGAILCGIAAGTIEQYSDEVKNLVEAMNTLMSKILSIIYSVIPAAVFTSVFIEFFSVTDTGYDVYICGIISLIAGIFLMIAVYMIQMAAHKIDPFDFMKKYKTLFWTNIKIGSSLDAVGYNIRGARKCFGLPVDFLETSIPLGANINMDASSMYITVVVLLMGVANGINPSVEQICIVAALALCMSVGAPNQPGTGIVTIAVIMPILNIPNDVICVAIVLETVLGALCAAFNTTGDVVSSMIIAKKFKMIE